MPALDSVVEGELLTFMSSVHTQCVNAGDKNEERLTAPSHALLEALLAQLGDADVTIVDKTSIKLDTPEEERIGIPDLSLYDRFGRLILCVELKAPGKGACPDKFTTAHDKKQWQHYKNLPNLIYTDGNHWTLWHTGVPSSHNLDICDDITSDVPNEHVDTGTSSKFFTEALRWAPAKIKTAKKLASECAKYCKMLRSQVEALPQDTLAHISKDWRDHLFPDLDAGKFIDAYTQTVTFALLSASSLGINFELGLDATRYDRLNLQLFHIASELEKRRGVLGKSLSLLTSAAKIRDNLHTYLEVIVTLVGGVDWNAIRSTGGTTAWLHFYEDFLAEYDKKLRQESGSYYTPSPVVEWMTRFADVLLVDRLGVQEGFADECVTVVDPATGTGTYLLGVLDRVAERVASTTGPGDVGDATASAAKSRLVGFEIQSGPYAVAQLRLAEHLRSFDPAYSRDEQVRVYLTDTLSDPYKASADMPLFFEALSKSFEAANQVKKTESVVVVIGNPPYLSAAGGQGGWVEEHIVGDWKPPLGWELTAHAKELSNLYVYFWRWAGWKVFEDSPQRPSPHEPKKEVAKRTEDASRQSGVVSFITTTGFLGGPGFQRMRQWLREWCSEIWVLDLSPEGHRSAINTRVFQAMQHPVAIVTAVRKPGTRTDTAARVHFHQITSGKRSDKFKAIAALTDPDSAEWQSVSYDKNVNWRSPFTPSPGGSWPKMVPLLDLFPWDGNGVMVGRGWPVSPDKATLGKRWKKLLKTAPEEAQRNALVQTTDDCRINKPKHDNLISDVPYRPAIQNETVTTVKLQPYGYRSFDRQWLIRDKRLINRPNPSIWAAHSDEAQTYLVVPAISSLSTRPLIAKSTGAIVSFSASIPDMDFLAGSRGGRVHPLWRNGIGTAGNVSSDLLAHLAKRYGRTTVLPQDLLAYVAAVTAHPAFTRDFRPELKLATEIRVPLTADANHFEQAVALGQKILALHTFGARCKDAVLPTVSNVPSVTKAMPHNAERIEHEPSHSKLLVHGSTNGKSVTGVIDNVSQQVYDYTIADNNIIASWFGYRKLNPDKKRSSILDDVNPSRWQRTYTRDLIELLTTLTKLTQLHDEQEQLLSDIMAGQLETPDELTKASVLPIPAALRKPPEPFKRDKPLFSDDEEDASPGADQE